MAVAKMMMLLGVGGGGEIKFDDGVGVAPKDKVCFLIVKSAYQFWGVMSPTSTLTTGLQPDNHLRGYHI